MFEEQCGNKPQDDEGPEVAAPRPSQNEPSKDTVTGAAASANPSTPHAAARALLAAGLTPLPTAPGKKFPAVAWKEYTTRRPTREEVEGWYADDPRRGVALMMGPALLAVDVDTKSGGDPAPFFGTTPAVQYTPNKGFHFLYKLNGTAAYVRPRTGVRQGIDLRTKESIIVLAPTAIPAADGETRAYTLEAGALEALLRGDLPDAMSVPAVRALLERDGADGPGPGAGAGAGAGGGQAEWKTVDHEGWDREVEGILASPEQCAIGTQEETLAHVCWWGADRLVRGTLTYEAVFGKLATWLRRVPLGNTHNPWTTGHLQQKLEAALKKRERQEQERQSQRVGIDNLSAEAGGGGRGEEAAAGGRGEEAAARGGVAGGGGAAAKELRFVSYDELAAQVREMSKRPWLVPDWLRARGLFLIAGASHFGKTWLSIDLAVSAAIGGKFLNAYAVDPGEDGGRRVLYIVGEDDALDFMERLDAVLAAKGAQPRAYLEGDEEGPGECAEARARHDAFRHNFRVHVERQFLFGDKAAQAALLKIVGEFKPSLVLFDPLKDMVPGEDVDGFFAGAVVHTRFLRDLRDAADCCLGIVHHTTKKLEWDKPDAGISGRTEFIASFEHRFICFRAPVGGDDDGTALRWTRGVIQRRIKSSPPLDPVAMRYAGSGEELVLLAEEVTENEGKAIVAGKSRSEEVEPHVLAIIQAHGPISNHGITEHLKEAGYSVHRTKTVPQVLAWLRAAGKVARTKRGWVMASEEESGSPGSPAKTPGGREGSTTRSKGSAGREREVDPSSLRKEGPKGSRDPLGPGSSGAGREGGKKANQQKEIREVGKLGRRGGKLQKPRKVATKTTARTRTRTRAGKAVGR